MYSHYYKSRSKLVCCLSRIAVTIVGFLLVAVVNCLNAQTLTTDQPDYPPGSTVILTGSGFQPGEGVRLQVVHSNAEGDNATSSAHLPWTVVADETGAFVTSWFIPVDGDELNALLLATADGLSSSLHAEVSFTDANWTIGPSYTDICGGVEGQFLFTITQTNNVGFLNSRFRIVLPGSASISSVSIVSVSSSKNWTLSVTGGNDICLRGVNQVTDALSAGESITFLLVATPANSLGQVSINGVSAGAGANCPAMGTTATLPLNILRVARLSPAFTQCPSNISVNTDNGLCSAVVNYTATATGTDPTVSYQFSGATTGTGSGTGSGSAFNKGTTHVVITATNSCATTTCSFDVHVTDNEPPVIACPSNIQLRSCDNTATWTAPGATDNCPGVTVAQTGGPASGSEFAKGSSTDITYTATDLTGNTSSCTFTVTRTDAPDMSVGVNNYNQQLYFGFAADQSATVTVTPSGGVGPYEIKTEMNRALICDYINNAGDEAWTSAASSFNNSCPSSPAAPYSQVNPGSSLSVQVTLLSNATLITTVKDQQGCEASRSDVIYAEDVRCFAGNSGITKVTVCHQTGSPQKPCHTICVDEDAVQAHLDHGDFLGTCTPDCSITQPLVDNSMSGLLPADDLAGKTFKVKISNNPNSGSGEFSLAIESRSIERVNIRVSSMNGVKVFAATGNPSQVYRFGSAFSLGIYVVEVVQGKEVRRVKVIKAN